MLLPGAGILSSCSELSHLLTKSYQPADTAVRSCSGSSHRSHDALLVAAVRDTEGPLHSDSLLLLLASLRQLVSTGAILHSWVLSHPSGPELQSSLCNCAAAVRSDVEHQYGHEVGNLGRVEIQSSFSRADRL